MEYLSFRGTYADIPVKEIVTAFRQTYGEERTRAWIESFEKYGVIRPGCFDQEDIVTLASDRR